MIQGSWEKLFLPLGLHCLKGHMPLFFQDKRERQAQVPGSAFLVINLGAGEGCELTPGGFGTPSLEDSSLFSTKPWGAMKLGSLESVKRGVDPCCDPRILCCQPGLHAPQPHSCPVSQFLGPWGFPPGWEPEHCVSVSLKSCLRALLSASLWVLWSPRLTSPSHQIYMYAHVYLRLGIFYKWMNSIYPEWWGE